MSDILSSLFDSGQCRLVAAGAWLFHQGDPIRSMYFVVEGTLDVVRVTGTGATVIQQRARPRQILAEASAYSSNYHCDARAVKTAALRALPVTRFRELMAEEPLVARAWAEHLAHAVQSARMRSEILALRTVAERLDAWLREGRHLPTKGAWQDLAVELGVSREALYRELSKRRRDRK